MQDCSLCPRRIRPGQVIAKVFATGEWTHVGCLVRSINLPHGAPGAL